jgi:lysozyme
MKASFNCINLIKRFEGFSAKPYRCPAGIWTIGYGSTRYANGKPISSGDAHITEAQAVEIMQATLGEYENAVKRYVTTPINQNQFDALVDFAYNAGAQNLRTSTLLKKVNAKDYAGAANEFGKWVFAGGKKLSGLVNRRAAEKALFLS